MNDQVKVWLCVASTFALWASAGAATADVSGSPYDGIVQRNIFNLKDPPVQTNNPAPPVVIPQIELSGITSILTPKRAILAWLTSPKPGQPARKESYILVEGQQEGDVQVLEIDEIAGTVKVNNHGQPQTLSFDKDGAKLVAAPPQVAASAQPQPQVNAVPAPISPSSAIVKTAPFRNPQARSAGLVGFEPDTPTTPANPAIAGGGVQGTFGQAIANTQPEVPTSYEQQTVMIELQRMKAQQQGSLLADILPPTPLSQKIKAEQEKNAQQPTPRSF